MPTLVVMLDHGHTHTHRRGLSTGIEILQETLVMKEDLVPVCFRTQQAKAVCKVHPR